MNNLMSGLIKQKIDKEPLDIICILIGQIPTQVLLFPKLVDLDIICIILISLYCRFTARYPSTHLEMDGARDASSEASS